MEKQDEIGGDTAKAMHTPGPWVASQGWNSHIDGDNTVKEYPNWIEVTGGELGTANYFSVSGHARMANARVIAAAPELLEAVKDLLDIIHDDLTHARQEDHKEALSAARAAIAKASDQQ